MIPLRDENPLRITPWLTYLLIAANVGIFLLEFTGGLGQSETGFVGALAGYSMVPAEITRGIDLPTNGVTVRPLWLSLFSCMFLHGGWLHLLGNMLYLFIFGNNIEEALGRVRFVLFYLLCGLCASAAQIAVSPGSVIPNLGASGAIAGVLGAYLVLFPTAKVDTLAFLAIFITRLRVPAFVILGFWIVSQFFSQFLGSQATEGESGGVAYMAHIGGFVAGMILIKLMGGKAPAPSPYGAYDVPDIHTGANYRR
ncbi:MAG: rhomboid family intramembrane serine protease [Armatimonadetes bacterium]|nr:rhomboid family intramembrane serine protease [Armatimonadota bacterium]